MSIEKDVEKLYLNDQERQKKKMKKKKKKKLIGLLIVVIILVALFLLMQYLGLGFGGGKGDGGTSGDSENAVSSVTDSFVAETTTTAVKKDYIDIKVSGSTYIYNGQEITVDDFVDTVKLMSENVVVNIKDDNATQNAMSSLEKALDESSREYVHAPDESSANESSLSDTATNATMTSRTALS